MITPPDTTYFFSQFFLSIYYLSVPFSRMFDFPLYILLIIGSMTMVYDTRDALLYGINKLGGLVIVRFQNSGPAYYCVLPKKRLTELVCINREI